MSSVLHLRKQLLAPPAAISVPGIGVRHMVVPDDVGRWLSLRDRAMADQTPAVRPWSPDDFLVEMLQKPWWQPERTWVAVSQPTPQQPVGAVTLAVRQGSAGEIPVVHWLLVDPAWRRRGIGRLLMSYLERAAWDAGWRELALETHSGWAAAVALYQSIGYAPPRDPSPG